MCAFPFPVSLCLYYGFLFYVSCDSRIFSRSPSSAAPLSPFLFVTLDFFLLVFCLSLTVSYILILFSFSFYRLPFSLSRSAYFLVFISLSTSPPPMLCFFFSCLLTSSLVFSIFLPFALSFAISLAYLSVYFPTYFSFYSYYLIFHFAHSFLILLPFCFFLNRISSLRSTLTPLMGDGYQFKSVLRLVATSISMLVFTMPDNSYPIIWPKLVQF